MIDRSSPFSLFGSSLAVVTCNSQEAEAGFGAVALNVKRLLGREAYVEMFLAAGRQGDLADKYKGLPLRTRIELFVNQQFVALAFNDCNCNVTEQVGTARAASGAVNSLAVDSVRSGAESSGSLAATAIACRRRDLWPISLCSSTLDDASEESENT